jgi:hypothetical protein
LCALYRFAPQTPQTCKPNAVRLISLTQNVPSSTKHAYTKEENSFETYEYDNHNSTKTRNVDLSQLKNHFIQCSNYINARVLARPTHFDYPPFSPILIENFQVQMDRLRLLLSDVIDGKPRTAM